MAFVEKRAIRKVKARVHLVGLADNIIDIHLVEEEIPVPLAVP